MQNRIPGLHQNISTSSTTITDAYEPIEEGLNPWVLAISWLKFQKTCFRMKFCWCPNIAGWRWNGRSPWLVLLYQLLSWTRPLQGKPKTYLLIIEDAPFSLCICYFWVKFFVPYLRQRDCVFVGTKLQLWSRQKAQISKSWTINNLSFLPHLSVKVAWFLWLSRLCVPSLWSSQLEMLNFNNKNS